MMVTMVLGHRDLRPSQGCIIIGYSLFVAHNTSMVTGGEEEATYGATKFYLG